jgi:hypothetical protein
MPESADRKPCFICKGPATVEQIDSSIGVLVTVECADAECSGSWNNGWFQELKCAEVAWNHRQIGEAAMNAVLPFTAATSVKACEHCGSSGKHAAFCLAIGGHVSAQTR